MGSSARFLHEFPCDNLQLRNESHTSGDLLPTDNLDLKPFKSTFKLKEKFSISSGGNGWIVAWSLVQCHYSMTESNIKQESNFLWCWFWNTIEATLTCCAISKIAPRSCSLCDVNTVRYKTMYALVNIPEWKAFVPKKQQYMRIWYAYQKTYTLQSLMC